MNDSHINVTVDFTKWGGKIVDLRIPRHQSVKALLINFIETLSFDDSHITQSSIKVTNKNLLLTDDDKLNDYPITNGDKLVII